MLQHSADQNFNCNCWPAMHMMLARLGRLSLQRCCAIQCWSSMLYGCQWCFGSALAAASCFFFSAAIASCFSYCRHNSNSAIRHKPYTYGLYCTLRATVCCTAHGCRKAVLQLLYTRVFKPLLVLLQGRGAVRCSACCRVEGHLRICGDASTPCSPPPTPRRLWGSQSSRACTAGTNICRSLMSLSSATSSSKRLLKSTQRQGVCPCFCC